MSTTTQPAHGKDAVTEGRPRRSRRRGRWLVVLVVVVALAGWGTAAALLLAGAAGALFDGRDAVGSARAALDDVDPQRAADQFAEGAAAFADAEANLRNPLVAPVRFVPVVGRNLRTVTELAAAGTLAADAGADLTGAVAGLPGGLGAFAPRDGAVPLDPLERLAAPAQRASAQLEAADAHLAAAPGEGLMGPVAEARGEFAGELARARDVVDMAAAVLDGLPAFLGADGPKRYLFGAQNPAELRGTGGLPGAMAILEIDEGRLEFGDFFPVQDLPFLPASAVEPPNPDYAARYNQFGGAGHWQNINMTPDFPAAATAMARLLEAGTGDVVDGVILADPMALAALLEVAGPTEVPGFGPVDADNVVAVVANEAYTVLTNPEPRKQLLGAVAAGALTGFLRADGVDPATAVAALADAVAGGHLLAYSSAPEVQEALDAGGVSGRLLDPEGDFLAVIGNNSANNKVDFYADRDVRYDVWLQPDGSAVARATVRLANHAPTGGLPRYVLGPYFEGLNAGDNRTILSVFCARECEVGEVRRDGEGHAVVEEELGHPVVSMATTLASGEAETFQYEWTVPDAWTDDDGDGAYRLTVQGQPTIRPTSLEVVVRLPDHTVVRETDPGMESGEGGWSWSGEAQRRNDFEVRFGSPEGPPLTTWERIREFLGRPVLRIGGDSGE